MSTPGPTTCPSCGAPLRPAYGAPAIRCDYCDTTVKSSRRSGRLSTPDGAEGLLAMIMDDIERAHPANRGAEIAKGRALFQRQAEPELHHLFEEAVARIA